MNKEKYIYNKINIKENKFNDNNNNLFIDLNLNFIKLERISKLLEISLNFINNKKEYPIFKLTCDICLSYIRILFSFFSSSCPLSKYFPL